MYYNNEELLDYIIHARRDLHKIPEVGTELPQTKKYVISKLKEFGLDYKECPNDSSLIVNIKGEQDGKIVALRADMDALPIKEETDFEYKSTNENMHACGHDAHTAMLLGCAKILSKNRDKIKGTVRLLFQTAEEGTRGASIIVENGAMDNVSAVVGAHVGIVSPEVPNGCFVIQDGPLMASSDKIEIKIIGKGSHAANPESGVDPITTAAIIIQAIQNIKTREISATEPIVVSICAIEGGNAYNVIPDCVNIKGTIRTFTEDTRIKVAKRIEEITIGIASAMNAVAEVNILKGDPSVVNDLKISNDIIKIAKEKLGEEYIYPKRINPVMGAEDFSVYQQKAPGVFILFSTKTEKNIPHHNCKFEIDESKLNMPAILMSKWALDYLSNN